MALWSLDVSYPPVADGSVAGLYLFPSSARGKGKWILRYVSPVTGKRRDMGLGRYPEVNITAARKSAFEARAAISADYDPLELKQAEKEAARAEANTPMFEAAAHRVFEEIRPGFRNRKHADQWIGTLERYVFPVIGPRFVADLRASDFADVL